VRRAGEAITGADTVIEATVGPEVAGRRLDAALAEAVADLSRARAQALIRAGRVRALAQGRVHVAFEDIRAFATEVIQHRVLLNYDGQAENIKVSDLVDEITQLVPEEGPRRKNAAPVAVKA
jgi:MoxR-like ATPase